jgi:hypothetical protein
MAKKKKTAPPTVELPPGKTIKIRLLAPWGDRPAGSEVRVDRTRAEKMIPELAEVAHGR